MNAVTSGFLKLAIIAAVVLAHAYFVATEYSIVTLRRTRVQQLAAAGNARAALVLRLLNRLQDLIAAVQLGVTMASLALGALAEPTLATLLEPIFGFLPRAWSPITAHAVAIAVTFVIVTALDIVIAELVPKTLALQNSERVAFAVVRPIRVFMWVFSPFIDLLNFMGRAVISAINVAPAGEGGAPHSPDELKMLVAASTRAGVIDAEEQEMLFRVFEFSELAARQVMVPRTEVTGLEVGMPPQEVFAVLRRTRHTKYPVYRETLDDVLGVLYVRDLLNRWTEAGAVEGVDLQRLMREPLFVPDTTPIDDLLARMKRSRVHIGIVVDEYGGTAGLVTLEDVLERIVGEVRDEFELGRPEVDVLSDEEALVDGKVLVSDLNERFGLHLDDEEYDTVGGLVWGTLGRQPRVGDVVESDSYQLRVEAVQGRRVATVHLKRSQQPARAAESGEASA
jgi:CBS domain containing-hemolysin-like protein